MTKKTADIIKDPALPLLSCYAVVTFGCRDLSVGSRTNRYRSTFLPTSTGLQKGGGEGDWGGGGAGCELCFKCDYDQDY